MRMILENAKFSTNPLKTLGVHLDAQQKGEIPPKLHAGPCPHRTTFFCSRRASCVAGNPKNRLLKPPLGLDLIVSIPMVQPMAIMVDLPKKRTRHSKGSYFEK